MKGLISVNNSIFKPEEAAVPALDRGLLFADNAIEVMVAFHGQIIDFESHINRLRSSASELDIPVPWTDEEFKFEIESLLESLSMLKANIRIMITRGNGISLDVPEGLIPNKIIWCYPAKLQDNRIYENGISLKNKLLPYTNRGPAPKTGNYLRSITALNKAKKESFDDVLWANSSEELTEATTANIFFIGRQGDLVEIATPPANSGLLVGITRNTIASLLRRSQIAVTERIIYKDEIARFDEAFVCSTVRGLVPVCRIDRHRMHTMRENSTFRHINRLYLTWIESQLGFRVDWNDGTAVK